MWNINLALNIKQNQTSVLTVWLFVPSQYNYSCMTAAPAGYSPRWLYFALNACPALNDEITALELPVKIHLERLSAAAQSHFYHCLGVFVWLFFCLFVYFCIAFYQSSWTKKDLFLIIKGLWTNSQGKAIKVEGINFYSSVPLKE